MQINPEGIYLVLRDRLSLKQQLVRIAGGIETIVDLESQSGVKSIFGLNLGKTLFLLFEDGHLDIYDQTKLVEFKSTQLTIGDFNEKAFANVRFSELPETAKILQASIVGGCLFAKITYLEGPKQLPKYFFELVGLKHELTPDESSIKRVLKGLEASEDSKISCLEPS